MIPSDRDVWLSKERKEKNKKNDLVNDGWLMEEELRGKESDLTDENINKRVQCIKNELLRTSCVQQDCHKTVNLF